MALKVGTENKRNVIIVAVLGCVLIFLAVRTIFGGSDAPPPAAPRAVVVNRTIARPSAGSGQVVQTAGDDASGPAAHKVANSGLDPALHLEKLALSESIEYAGNGRNIFSADSAPVKIETPVAAARPGNLLAAAGPVGPAPYVAPQPPAIDLKFFGFTAKADGKREAFLIHGDDIFEASVGEIVNHRYKVVAVNASSVQLTDLSYNNTQTLPLSSN
jgi:hypothetical protein